MMIRLIIFVFTLLLLTEAMSADTTSYSCLPGLNLLQISDDVHITNEVTMRVYLVRNDDSGLTKLLMIRKGKSERVVDTYTGWCCQTYIFTVNGKNNYIGIVNGPGANGRLLNVYKYIDNNPIEAPEIVKLTNNGLIFNGAGLKAKNCQLHFLWGMDEISFSSYQKERIAFGHKDVCIENVIHIGNP